MTKLNFTLVLITLSQLVFSQDWELVWSDEFTTGIGSDWVFEYGNGSSGWGNNELQYYQESNATVTDGVLEITAKLESVGGYSYTSARMKTLGQASWKYGKMEARIKLPAFTGSWPAFWMLGETIYSAGWPACGEIDVMEQINTEAKSYATVHWTNSNGSYTNSGSSISNIVTDFHVYAIEWDELEIRWYIDDVQYYAVDISDGTNGSDELHEEFFILLNMAIGGNWPGFTVDESALPATMYIDYVRVYEDSGDDEVGDDTELLIPGSIEAEYYTDMSGVEIETCEDIDGGENVTSIDAGDWFEYEVDVEAEGTYTVSYRVASETEGGNFTVSSDGSDLSTISFDATGDWQVWTSVSDNISLSAGVQTIRITANTGNWSINWFEFTTNSSITIPVAGVSISPTSISISEGASTQLTATISPSNASNQEVSWISDDATVASVSSSGGVTAVAEGSTYITVSTSDGSKTATCQVEVSIATSTDCDSPEEIDNSYSFDGLGDNCWVLFSEPSYVSSWNLEELTINGEDYTNTWSNTLPDAVDGEWVIHYVGNYDWSHFEASGTKSASGELIQSNGNIIYPNPASDYLSVNTENTILKASIYSSEGRIIKTDFVNANYHVMDLRNIEKGMYFIKVETKNDVITKNLIVK